MKKLLTILLLLPLLIFGQTAQLNFTYKSGSTVKGWQVMDLPTSIFTYSVPQGQLLIYYPTAYAAGKLCGLGIWQGGDGENNSLDASQVLLNSLPQMITAGRVKPFSILPKGDTLWWVICAIHNNSGSAYRTQLKQILPWIYDKSGIKHDTIHRFISGLSGGGSAAWASIMIDTALAKRVRTILPLANGGYDSQLSALMSNLVQACKNGTWYFPFIGTQDPGFNAVGFFAYDAVLKQYALPDHYHPHVIPGGRHDSTTWNVPWGMRSIWDSLGYIGYVPSSKPTDSPVHAKILISATTITYPTTSVYLYDSSYAGSGVLNNSYIMVDSVPSGSGIKGAVLGKGYWLFNLTPGGYRAKAYAFDSATNYVDTFYVRFTVVGPPPRKVISLQVPFFGIMVSIPIDAAKIGYDDGTTN